MVDGRWSLVSLRCHCCIDQCTLTNDHRPSTICYFRKEMLMETRRFVLAAVVVLAALLFQTASPAQTPSALTGKVASAEEGSMEGVVVTAKKDGATISVSVVTNDQGRFAFPAARL